MKFSGSLEELQAVIKELGFNIACTTQCENAHQIRTEGGAIVMWYPNTKTLMFQGSKEEKDRLIDAWKSHKEGTSTTQSGATEPKNPYAPTNPATANKKVFLVHGHDTTSREQLELVLHKLGLDPFVLANTGGGGLTIIEALEAEIGPRSNQARFGIVLMTPDDMGYSKIDGEQAIQPRARQNVVLETGMLISALGRGNVAILKRGHLEVPSDAQGILYISFNDHVKEAVPKLANRLHEAGFTLSPEAITKASS